MADKKPLKREEVPVELTWDLSLIYDSNEGFEKDLEFVILQILSPFQTLHLNRK